MHCFSEFMFFYLFFPCNLAERMELNYFLFFFPLSRKLFVARTKNEAKFTEFSAKKKLGEKAGKLYLNN